MDTWFAASRTSHLIAGVWAVLLVLFLLSGTPAFAKGAALVGYVIAFVAYPVALVLGSTALQSSKGPRFVVVAGVLVFMGAFLVRDFDETPGDLLYSSIGMIALLLVQFMAVGVLVTNERRLGLTGSSVGAWFSLLFLIFGGLGFVHGRYQRVVARAG